MRSSCGACLPPHPRICVAQDLSLPHACTRAEDGGHSHLHGGMLVPFLTSMLALMSQCKTIPLRGGTSSYAVVVEIGLNCRYSVRTNGGRVYIDSKSSVPTPQGPCLTSCTPPRDYTSSDMSPPPDLYTSTCSTTLFDCGDYSLVRPFRVTHKGLEGGVGTTLIL